MTNADKFTAIWIRLLDNDEDAEWLWIVLGQLQRALAMTSR